MEQIVAAAVASLIAGIFGAVKYQNWRNKQNGVDDAGRIVTAIQAEGTATRRVLHDHNEANRALLATMKESCAVKHAELLGEIKINR